MQWLIYIEINVFIRFYHENYLIGFGNVQNMN